MAKGNPERCLFAGSTTPKENEGLREKFFEKMQWLFYRKYFFVFVFRVLQPVIRKKKSPPPSPVLIHEFSTVLIKEFSKQEVANLRRKVEAQLMKV